MKMSKRKAEKWADDICREGTGEIMNQYRDKFGVGKLDIGVWNDGVFKYGVELGVLIAVAKLYGDLDA